MSTDFNSYRGLNTFSATTENGPVRAINISKFDHIGNVKIGTDSVLSESEQRALLISLISLDKYVSIHGPSSIRPLCEATLLLINSDTFSITSNCSTVNGISCVTNGAVLRIIVCYLNRLRRLELLEIYMAATLLEEICHYAFDIYDENIVKHKVVEILRCAGIKTTVDSLFGHIG